MRVQVHRTGETRKFHGSSQNRRRAERHLRKGERIPEWECGERHRDEETKGLTLVANKETRERHQRGA